MKAQLDRRGFLQHTASLVVAVAAGGGFTLTPLRAGAQAWGARRAIGPAELDSWLAIGVQGGVTAFFGKMDMGQGVETAIAQVVAEELDVSVERVEVVMADTHRTPNQGGASGSTACRLGSIALRNAAAEARRVLLLRAAERLGAPVAALKVVDGTVQVAADAARRVSYAELVAQGFATGLDWNRQYGNGLLVTGKAQPKDPRAYQVVGASVARKDIPGKMLATTEFCHHVTLPGMLHARSIRPPVANAVPLEVDAASIANLPGVRIVRRQNYIAVLAEKEWHAVKAARQLKVTWSATKPPFPAMEQLYPHIRKAPVVGSGASSGPEPESGQGIKPEPVLAAIAAAARRVQAEYEIPFQSHARMGPSVAVADVRADEALVFSDTQKSHNTRDGLAKLLKLSPEQVRLVWKPGPGSYGRSDADEAAFEAALLSQEVGRPVRMQWMRHEGHAWDPKAPAAVISCRAGLDAQGAITAWYFRAKGFSGQDVMYNAGEPSDTLVGQLTGWPKAGAQSFGVPVESYAFPQAVKYWQTIAPLQALGSPLRTAHMRAPQEPQLHFASECFIDEVAAAAGMDPVALRLGFLRNEREIAVLQAVVRASGWQPRPAPSGRRRGALLRGRGVAITGSFGSYVATVCEVEVERRTGRVWARRFFVAHDCGLIINPQSLKTTIEGNIVQGISRTLFEEVRFDTRTVQSVDWATYPILEMRDAPEHIEIVTLNRPDVAIGGAGEPAHVTVPAAIGNALFDATGVRFRRLPLSAARVRAALA